MSSRSARRRGERKVPRYIPARCWCGAIARTWVKLGGMRGPVCLDHTDPERWPPQLLVRIIDR